MRRRPKRLRRVAGTWWIAGIAFPLGNGEVGILPPILGLSYNDQDRAIIRAVLAALPWSRVLGGNHEETLPQLRVQALAVAARDVPQIQQELENQRDNHPNENARQAALITLGQSPEAEAIPIPQYLLDMKSPRHAGCTHATPIKVRVPDGDDRPHGTRTQATMGGTWNGPRGRRNEPTERHSINPACPASPGARG